MSTVQEDREKLKKKAEELLAESARLHGLSEEYPDLRKYIGRWEKVVWCSKSINAKVQRFDIRHNCGCCNDSPLEIWPYLETPHGNIYSDPPMYQVGERYWMGGDKPNAGWKSALRAASIPEEIIGAVQMHFNRCKQDRIDSASADEEVYDEPSDD